MAFSPEEIEARQREMARRDLDESADNGSVTRLFDVAEQAARDAAASSPSPSTDARRGKEAKPSADFARLNEAVSQVMRAAQEAITNQREDAEREAEEVRRAADAFARLVRADADTYAEQRRKESDGDRAEARRLVTQAQEEAIALVADAHERAAAMVRDAESQAKARRSEVLFLARQHLDQLIEKERETRRRLQATQSQLQSLLSAASLPDQPDIDLTDGSPLLRNSDAGWPLRDEAADADTGIDTDADTR